MWMKYNFFIYLFISMDDYIDYDTEENQIQEQKYPNFLSSYFNLDNDFIDVSHCLTSDKSLDLPCTAESQNQNHQNFQQHPYIPTYTQGLYTYESRKTNKIETSNKKTKNQYIQAKKGNQKQTKQLCINYKTLIVNIVNSHQLPDQFNQCQKGIIKQFEDSQANLSNFRKFFGITEHTTSDKQKNHRSCLMYDSQKSDRIRKKCRQKLNSKLSVETILKSKKMSISNKITTIKFIQMLSKGCTQPQQFYHWKPE